MNNIVFVDRTDITEIPVVLTHADGRQESFTIPFRLIEKDDPSLSKEIRDNKGNLWIDNTLVESSPVAVDDDHFYCVICKAAVSVTVDGGFQCGINIGGCMCNRHKDQGK